MCRTLGASLAGIEGVAVEVEVRISSLLPRVDIVGLPEAAVREAGARVRGAIAAIGRPFPDRRITVNLAPAGLRKSGAGLDLPIAVGILAAAGVLEREPLEGRAFLGELALDGRLRPVQGSLALVLACRDAGHPQVIVPTANAAEAALAPNVDVRGAPDLEAVLEHLTGASTLPRAEAPPLIDGAVTGPCLSDVRGQERGKRALEITAAGGHALLLQGPPGAGKTMLARRLAPLLPPLSFDEALEVTLIHGAAGRLPREGPLAMRRPFRAPHHTASLAGLLGGGSPPRPGEISLAHRGVLFLDEFPEFERRSLEALRQVLEDRRVRISRARLSCEFPADFILVAAANPCQCGWYRSGKRDCRCDEAAIARYRRRISGPLLDRIDLHVQLSALSWRELDQPAGAITSHDVRDRVVAARTHQQRRGVRANAEISDAALDASVRATIEARRLLGRAVDRLQLSARAARRVLRVARTVADLEGEDRVGASALAEALSYRNES
ncbi:MAG: YifB family Mg chelatase-like AAA ATPase [Proteobacteria bacterium]|nr:YifB family Mg chelatase-like AAA ATPase [Pseudomonadota bacterium]